MKKLAILGSTGNVGTQVLDVVDKYPDKFKIIALSANGNVDLLREQIRRYQPMFVGVADEIKAKELKEQIDVPVFFGEKANIQIAELDEYDTLINSVVSLAGIEATLKAIEKKKNVALANKETLVSAGEIVMREARKNGVKIMPIDSEHSALFQCLNGEGMKTVERLVITCSGGALRDKTKKEIEEATIEEALGHKTWAMGQKITIDSATLMNKGFEVIEAMWLYDMPIEKIKVIIHPESIIHSMVEYTDASIIAQMSEPDMRLPIQYALSYPERWEASIKRFNFDKNLTFKEPDLERFSCLGLAFWAAKELGTLPAVMNATNDFMVAKFLAGECKIGEIYKTIKQIMEAHENIKNPSLEDINNSISWAREKAQEIFKK
ncbi:MAG: 1-deoxy-D-xylulose-5-phosphate reductoisomerase [Candidatus Moranbacteria bacterium]|jgi:1-deoxy-D-xylulose-5-phosphate reductoisomerase|nr:1-deoxy-D-xylulose-5-phosphate reductoisomerase [Candidatus Moranbacteria bacterium]